MSIDIKTVSFSLSEDQKNDINKRLTRLNFAADIITDIQLTISFSQQYSYDCIVNFAGGDKVRATTEDVNLTNGENKLLDILMQKVIREKIKLG